MEPQTREKAGGKKGGNRAHRDLAGADRAPAASVLAPAELEQVPITGPPSDPIGSNVMVVGIYAFLWFILYGGCAGSNMGRLENGDLPWGIGAAQLISGTIIATSLWVFRLRPAPRLTVKDARSIAPMAVWHALSHVCVAVGLGAGASAYLLNFMGVIFATEPLFATVFSTIFLKQAPPPLVYVTTLVLAIVGAGLVVKSPIFCGVDFHWVAVCGAVGFNLAASMCSILSKRSMGMDIGENMSPANLYAVVNIMAAAMFLPLAIIMECSGTMKLLMGIVDSLVSGNQEFFAFLLDGVYFHLCNELAFRCLGRLHPSTYTVGSAFKFIFFMIVLMLVIDEELELTSVVARGSLIAIVGVLLYTLAATRQGKQESGSL